VSGLLICTLVTRPPEPGHESHNSTRHEQDDGHDEALEITKGDLVTQFFKTHPPEGAVNRQEQEHQDNTQFLTE